MKLGNIFTLHHLITHMKVVVVGNMLTNVRSFIILQSGEGLTSFNKDNSVIFSKEKKYNEAQFRGGVYSLDII